MSWTVIVPLKAEGQRKSRLAERLGPEARSALSLRMFDHVIEVLRQQPRICRIIVLANERPNAWDHCWRLDGGKGLNAELDATRADIGGAILTVHSDLPLLAVEDMDALIQAAEHHGVAFAPDRHGLGTNAAAFSDMRDFRFKFGPDSFHLHSQQVTDYGVVRRTGLSLDVDTPDDLDYAIAAGWR